MWSTFRSAASALLHDKETTRCPSERSSPQHPIKLVHWCQGKFSCSTLPPLNQQLNTQLPIFLKKVGWPEGPKVQQVSVRLLWFWQPNLHKVTPLPLSQATLFILPSNAIRRQDQLSPTKPRPRRTERKRPHPKPFLNLRGGNGLLLLLVVVVVVLVVVLVVLVVLVVALVVAAVVEIVIGVE